MNTNAIARRYEQLVPCERLPMIMAASGRDDEQGRLRLGQSAPKVWWRVPDYLGRSLAFREISDLHFMELLDQGGQYFQSLALSATADQVESIQLFDPGLMLGFRLTVQLAGWRLFCRGENLDPELCWSCLPGCTTIQEAERLADKAAFKFEGAVAYLQRCGRPAKAVVTAEVVAEGLAACYRKRIAWWNRELRS